MSYLEGLARLKKIENENDVMSIKFKNQEIWPFIRIYLMQDLAKTSNINAHQVSGNKIKIIVRSLFSFPFKELFKHHKIWVFNGAERRKQIGNKYIQRVSGFIADSGIDFLDIEKPSYNHGHFNKNEIEEKYIVSEGWIIFIAHILERFTRIFPSKIKITNEKIIKNILNQEESNFNYRYFVRFLWAQKLTLEFLMKFLGIPQIAFIECPYNIMGYVWALKEKNTRIIELQHGVLNDSHYAYVLKHKSIFSPDEIWVFGEREYKFLNKDNPEYADIIRSSGLYFLERSNKAFSQDIFKEFREKYAKIIVVSGQSAVKEPIHDFIKEIANLNRNFLFVYIPRSNQEVLGFSKPNVLFKPDVNIYQYLKWCDIHVTVSSTTCLEAMYFGKPTIFFDYTNLATQYYGEFLLPENGVQYIKRAEEFTNAVVAVESINKNNYKQPFAPFFGNKYLKDYEEIYSSNT